MLRILIISIILSSCAISHHVQVGDIVRTGKGKLTPFDIKLSQTGVNIKEAANVVSAVTKDNNRAQKIAEIIALFQMGPKTGNPVFNEKYADQVPKVILEKCPSGKVTGLLMIRETAKYPVVSGEIVRVTGYCRG